MKYTVDSPEVLRDHAEVTNGHAYKNAGGRFIGKEMMTREEELQHIADHWNKLDESDRKARIKNSANDLLDALEAIMPSELCGESWDLPDGEHVSIQTTFGTIRQARAAIKKARGQ